MDIFGWIAMLGGLAMFLYGMHLMGEGLQSGGGKLVGSMEKITSNPFMAVLLGLGITAVIQSSSATTVMVVGFVNSATLQLEQAAGVIMGANIGTTVTSWILSLTGLSGDNPIITALKPSTFAPLMAMIGVIMLVFLKKEKLHTIGKVLFGLGLLLVGMDFMSDAVKPLADDPNFTNLLLMFSNPILGVLAGAVITAAIQSSSASVGILQALILTGTIPYSAVLPIIMGQNIGTCVTTLISSIGTSKNAKRAAFIHLYFNIIGTVIFMAGFYTINAFHPFAFLGEAATPIGIAIFHTFFNLLTTAILLPNRKLLVKLACRTVRGKATIEEEADEELAQNLSKINDIFLNQPAAAVDQAFEVTVKMSETAKESMNIALSLLHNYDEEQANRVTIMETQVDKYEDKLGTFLLKISAKELNNKQADKVGVMLRMFADLERISDHSENIMLSAKEIHEKKENFSPEIVSDMLVFENAIRDILETTHNGLVTGDVMVAKRVEPLEEVIKGLSIKLRERRVKYLTTGNCTMVTSFILSDLNIYLERVAAHCSNIAIATIEVAKGDLSLDMHEYIEAVKKSDSDEFQRDVTFYADKYRLHEFEKEPVEAQPAIGEKS